MTAEKEIAILRTEMDALSAEIAALKFDMVEVQDDVAALRELIEPLLQNYR